MRVLLWRAEEWGLTVGSGRTIPRGATLLGGIVAATVTNGHRVRGCLRDIEKFDKPVFTVKAHKSIINKIDGALHSGPPELVTGSRDGMSPAKPPLSGRLDGFGSAHALHAACRCPLHQSGQILCGGGGGSKGRKYA